MRNSSHKTCQDRDRNVHSAARWFSKLAPPDSRGRGPRNHFFFLLHKQSLGNAACQSFFPSEGSARGPAMGQGNLSAEVPAVHEDTVSPAQEIPEFNSGRVLSALPSPSPLTCSVSVLHFRAHWQGRKRGSCTAQRRCYSGFSKQSSPGKSFYILTLLPTSPEKGADPEQRLQPHLFSQLPRQPEQGMKPPPRLTAALSSRPV